MIITNIQIENNQVVISSGKEININVMKEIIFATKSIWTWNKATIDCNIFDIESKNDTLKI